MGRTANGEPVAALTHPSGVSLHGYGNRYSSLDPSVTRTCTATPAGTVSMSIDFYPAAHPEPAPRRPTNPRPSSVARAWWAVTRLQTVWPIRCHNSNGSNLVRRRFINLFTGLCLRERRAMFAALHGTWPAHGAVCAAKGVGTAATSHTMRAWADMGAVNRTVPAEG